jgi:hypothetical protein
LKELHMAGRPRRRTRLARENPRVPFLVQQRIRRSPVIREGLKKGALSFQEDTLQAHAGSDGFDSWVMESLGLQDPYVEGYVVLEAIEDELDRALKGTDYYAEPTGHDSWSFYPMM